MSSSLRVLACLFIASLFFGVAVPDANAAETQTAEQKTLAPPSGNQHLFSPEPRELQLPAGSQDLIAVGTLGVYLLLGLWILWKTGSYLSTLLSFLGVTTFYGGLVHHQWVISGHYPVGTGHLISLGICTLGISLAFLGVRALIGAMARATSNGRYPRILFPLYMLVFTLGFFTGHATIFEAAPTIFGIDMAPHHLGVMILAGSAAVTASILCLVHGLTKMHLLKSTG